MACSSPLVINGQRLACKSCDFCVGRRVHSWCARAMMEKESMGHALVVALTYDEESEHSARSARMFDYKDVQEFMWSLRRQLSYHFKVTSAVSFIAAGEMGDRFKRCHWHLVLFSQVDLIHVGKWFASWGQVTDRRKIITPAGAKNPKRCRWSLWDHGFVTVQEPDYGGMRYAMAYALKNQFNVRKTFGTGREAKSEVFSDGYFVPSKKPPIGARWVDAYLDMCARESLIPPTRALTVGGLDRPFWPTGLLADRLLGGLGEINSEIKARTGSDGAGWSSLLYEARLSDSDLEKMGAFGGEEIEEKRNPEDTALGGLRFEDRHKWARWHKAAAAWRANRANGSAQTSGAAVKKGAGGL